MIARRREANNLTPVNEIYDKAHATMTAALPALIAMLLEGQRAN